MYCYINPKLFKEFTSRKKKITPAISDDWEILPESYNSSSDITYYSKKLNQKISGCNVFTLLELLKNYKAKINGLKLEGEWIIGQDRKLYSKEDYEKWIKKYGSIVESEISLKNITYKDVGSLYQFKCGAKYYFLGFIKDEKGKKVRVFGNYQKNYDAWVFEFVKTKGKISRKIKGKKLSQKEIDDSFTYFLFRFSYKKYNVGDIELVKYYDKDEGIIYDKFIITRETYNDRNFTFDAFDEYGNEINPYCLFDEPFEYSFISLEAKYEDGFIYYRYKLNKNPIYDRAKERDSSALHSILKKYDFENWKKLERNLYFKRVKNYIK